MRKPSESYLKLKKATDKILSGAGLVVLSPVFAGIAIAIKAEDGLTAPVFFKQKRVGIHKNHFMLYKFRSMRTDTPHDTPTHLLTDPEQYLTRVGKWLRKTSLDELPQLLNIFHGDMAVVGPRPALWNQYDLLEERDRYGANDVCPGLTGWAQIHGRDELEIKEKARLDGYYVKHMNPVMDIRCILGTVSSVLKSEGVVEGGTGAMSSGRKMDKKKILIITNHSYMLYRFRKELIQKLLEDSEVVISTPFVGHETDLKELGANCIKTEVDRRSINPFTDLKLLHTYKTILKQEKPDLVITYSIKPNIYAGYLCGKMKIPFCANVQGLGTAFQKALLSNLVTVMYRTAFRKVETVFFENQANAQAFVRRRILPAKKEVVLSGAGINLEEYRYRQYPNNEKVHFLYLGRIMKEKGMDELFAAVEQLRKNGCEFVLDLVGFFEDEYKKQIEQLQSEGVVRFYGFQENPKPYYAQTDCVVLPSYHEGMSNVLLEAAASGRAIITTDIPGCREAVDNGKSGMLCKVKSTDSLYKAMKRFTELSREKRELLGKAGREKMEKKFNKKKVVEETVKVITKAMTKQERGMK
jgi:lipopolysaccharide/colanic/teichoic acid biosynthesis glycosyltransferase/glycosyltransferase involved in cell wall biosynthesis